VPQPDSRTLPAARDSGWAARALRADGFVELPAAAQADLLGTTAEHWERFDRHWDDLTLDRYMRDGGTYRYRRYGRYRLDAAAGDLTPLAHGSYRQDTTVNPLNGGIDRHFDPLTDSFRRDPLVEPLVRMLGDIVTAAAGHPVWDVELHPFRIVTGANQTGKPAPQGRHRDGVTYVTSLVVGRTNINGGQSSVYTDDGERRRSVTLQPGDQLLIDDRRMLHYVTPIEPADPARPACRDVLLVDFTVPAVPA
jgi:hypothetical protein